MINLCSYNKKILYVLIICVMLFTFIFTGVSSSQATNTALLNINDGYLYDYDEKESLRAIDFTIASSEIPAESRVESELIIANYGTTDTKISIEPYILDNEDETKISEEKYDVKPVENNKYEDVSFEPGEHKIYKFDFKFSEPDKDYKIGFINPDARNDEKPLVNKTIRTSDESSGTENSLILDRDKLTKNNIPVTRYKDMYSLNSFNAGSSMSLPPVEKDDDNNIIASDVAEGYVSDFGKIRSDSDTYGSIVGPEGDINIGFNAENIPVEEHYAISIIYELEDMDSADVDIVSSTGVEVDEHTDYYLNSESDIEDRIFQLSEKEINYIQNHNEIYFEFNTESQDEQIEIKLYEMQVIGLNEVWNIPDSDISADLESKEEVLLDNTVQIEATIENKGSIAINEDFRLQETQATGSTQTVAISDNEIINPGETKTVRFNVPISKLNEHTFKLYNGETSISVIEDEDDTQELTSNTEITDTDTINEDNSSNNIISYDFTLNLNMFRNY